MLKIIIASAVLFSDINIWAGAVEGNVDAKALLAWFDSEKVIPANIAVQANNKNMNNGGVGFCLQCSDQNSRPTAQNKTVSLYQNASAVFFAADMDIDCDGTSTGICGGTDPSHQGQLSCDSKGKCSKNNGGQVDASTTPFIVSSTGSPFSASSRGIDVGQLSVIINRLTNPPSIVYAPMLDEDGVAQEIGEASSGLAKLIGIDENPETGGGGGPSSIVYIIFRGIEARLTNVSDFADHQKAINLGQALAAKLITSAVKLKPMNTQNGMGSYRLGSHSLEIISEGIHRVSIFSINGLKLMESTYLKPKHYDLSSLNTGMYLIQVTTTKGSFLEKIVF
jgi:hypothetical protein